MLYNIQHITHANIDKVKWDACIRNATNGLIYGYSYYLNHMAKQWDALVLNDYEAVLPLTWNKKYGIAYLYQPFACAALGVFGPKITENLLETFLLNIPNTFRYWDVYFNAGNNFNLHGFTLYKRMNYTLALNQPYQSIYNSFNSNTKRNIKKAEQANCVVKKNFPISEVIQLAKLSSKRKTTINSTNLNNFRQLYNYLLKTNNAITYGISSSSGQLLASCVFFFSHNRAYYILVGNHTNGKAIGTSHALINAFIKDNAQSDLLLDFEGSDVDSVAAFYKGFGAQQEVYIGVRYNKLPFLLRWLKK